MAKLEFDDEGSRLVEEFNASAGATHGSRSNTGGVRKLTRQLEHIVDEDVDSVVIAPIDERADRSLIFIGKTGDLPGPLLTCYLNREICHVNYVLINRNNRLILFLLCSLKLRGSAIRREFRQSATEAL